MENNIASEFEGVVSAIKVKTGQSVLQSDVLVEIE
jgi:biotin carboxyl carrier protein